MVFPKNSIIHQKPQSFHTSVDSQKGFKELSVGHPKGMSCFLKGPYFLGTLFFKAIRKKARYSTKVRAMLYFIKRSKTLVLTAASGDSPFT